MNIKSELKKMRRLREDRIDLNNISNSFPKYFADIIRAKSQEELDLIDSRF